MLLMLLGYICVTVFSAVISLNTFHVSDIVEIYTQGQINDYVVTVDFTTSAENSICDLCIQVWLIMFVSFLNITIVNVLHEYHYTTIY